MSIILKGIIRLFSSLSSLGGSTGSKTLCMPGDGEIWVRVPDSAITFFFKPEMDFAAYPQRDFITNNYAFYDKYNYLNDEALKGLGIFPLVSVDFFCLSINLMELLILMLGNLCHGGRVSNSTLYDRKIIVIAGESASLHFMLEILLLRESQQLFTSCITTGLPALFISDFSCRQNNSEIMNISTFIF